MLVTNGRTLALCLGLTLAAVLAAYANHFQNGFHFDDTQTVVANLNIRHLDNIPRFFTDTKLFSAVAGNQVWRPVVSASLALDFWLGNGLKLFYFHLSTFVWFLVQLALMFALFRRIMDQADAHPSNAWTALVATACYGLHPANAETVNYIVQRADLYNALGVVASLLWFAAYPAQRKFGWYLIPAVAAYLSKPPALIYPFILLAYVYLFEKDRQWLPALRATLPAWVVTAAAAVLTVVMTPADYHPGAVSAYLYRLTQPWVALHYFKSFFLPNDLSADSDWGYVSGPFSGEALAGYLFVVGLVAVAVWASRRLETRPVAFGIAWFFLAMLPTSLTPLSDVTNDYRMFFPFVGLALAVFWALRLALFRRTARLTEHRAWLRGALAAVAVVLTAAAVGTYARNEVWRNEESLWRDVTIKSPNNGRGQFNYGNMLLVRGDFAGGLPHLERAQALNLDDGKIGRGTEPSVIEMRLATAYAGVGRDAEAGQHYENAVSLAPDAWEPHFYYGRWLHDTGRMAEAQVQLAAALRANPQSFASRYLLMQLACEQRNWPALDALIAQTQELVKDDEVARGYTLKYARLELGQAPAPEKLVGAAAGACQTRRYDECLSNARQALAIRPNYAEAYYVASGALFARGRNADAIHALRMAIRIQPDYTAAKDTLTGVVQ
jgi:tetratricopeptide (TPR) repeat protein